MEINLLIALGSSSSELHYIKGVDADGRIDVSKNKDEAKRFPFNEKTFNESFKLPKAIIGLCLRPIFLFEVAKEKKMVGLLK